MKQYQKKKGGEIMKKDVFDEMADKWPSAIVTRPEVVRFTGGLMRGSFLANLDSRGEGPPRQRIGRKWGYPVREFAEWLRVRSAGNDNL